MPDAPLSEVFAPLREQLLAAAEEFSEQPLGELLADIVSDVERAAAEPLEIFPVAHHSPASAVHAVKRLKSRPPKVIFIELCADMQGLILTWPTARCPWRCRPSPRPRRASTRRR
ncbi:MAG: hypothetical protein H6740_27325 [Alphaproteobacteria bacterium]|nr:hypothetical protein [Alphaproteobacteria bacterium]